MNEYAQYDDLRESLDGQMDLFVPLNGQGDDAGRNLHRVVVDQGTEEEVSEILCHVPVMFRWTSSSVSFDTGNTDYADVSSEAYGGSVAAFLAMHHLNTGNAAVVDELEGLSERCPIRFTMELLDSGSSGSKAMQQLTRLLTRDPQNITAPQPCALLGSSWSSITKKLATVTGVYDLPHITSSASSVDLDDEAEYPLFTRTHPSDASMARLSMDYLRTQRNVDFVGVLYIDNAFGNSYVQVLLEAANDYQMTVQSQSFRGGASDDEVRTALERLKESGYRYFLGVFFGGDYDRIMTMAFELDMAGPGRFWMFNGALASKFVNAATQLPTDSPVAKATFGNAILTDEGGLPGNNVHHDRFLEQWTNMDPELLNYIHSKLPVSVSDEINFERDTTFFTNFAPSHIAAFSYDAIISLGLAACQAHEDQASDAIFSGARHYENIRATNYSGASGDVVIGPETHSRKAESTVHVVFNILPKNGEEGDKNQFTTFQGNPLTLFDTQNKTWISYSNNPFIYSDGTTTAPQQIPELSTNMNGITTPIRAVCLSLSGMAMLLSVGFYLYCCVYKGEHRIIRYAQPLFLGYVCAGAFLMASSTIPASLDDTIISQSGADIACICKFWLFPIGFCTVFAALFSKLWRISILLKQAREFHRIEVKARDVMIPFATLLGLNVLVLSLWTIIDQPYWSREPSELDSFGRVSESSGKCTSDSMSAFIGPLLAINGCALVLAIWQAYVSRAVSNHFSESKQIAMATACIFQALFMGVPILFIVDDSPTALLFVETGIVTIICFSVLLLLFVPKIQAIHFHDPDTIDPRQTLFTPASPGVSGLSMSSPTSGASRGKNQQHKPPRYRSSSGSNRSASGSLGPIDEHDEVHYDRPEEPMQ